MDERDYRAMNKELKQQQSDVRYTVLPAVPYQCCPLCNGHGQTLAEGFTSVVYEVCKVCNGKRIIPMHVIEVRNELPNTFL